MKISRIVQTTRTAFLCTSFSRMKQEVSLQKQQHSMLFECSFLSCPDDCQTTALVVDSSSSSSSWPVPITAITVCRSHHRSDNCHPAQQQQHRATIIRRGGGQRVLKRQQWQQQQQRSQCFMFELSSEVHCSRIHRTENRKSRRRKKDGHRYTAGHELTVCLSD